MSTIYELYRRCLYRYTRYSLWWQKSGNKVSLNMLKSEKLANSPKKTLDYCCEMKFDLSDNQLLHKDELFNRWGLLENMSQTLPLNCSNQFTVKSNCSSIMSIKMLTLNLLTRCETEQLRTIFIDNLRAFLQKKKKKNGGRDCGSEWIL